MNVILIAGTAYEAVPVSTLGHDIYMQSVLDDYGLAPLLLVEGEETPELAKERAKAFQRKLAESEAAPKLLSGLLQKRGVPWNPTDAAAAFESFRTTTNAQDKALLLMTLGTALSDFFRRARRSFATSR